MRDMRGLGIFPGERFLVFFQTSALRILALVKAHQYSLNGSSPAPSPTTICVLGRLFPSRLRAKETEQGEAEAGEKK